MVFDPKQPVPFEWAIKDVAQPTLKEIGFDIKNLYSSVKRVILNSVTKSKKGIVNKRVATEVLRSGGVIESNAAVEYFGGILASARSDTGEDDSSIFYVELTKSLSSSQIHLHYIIYNSLQKIFVNNHEKYGSLNVAQEMDIQSIQIFFSPEEIQEKLGINLGVDLFVLVQSGLINQNFSVTWNDDKHEGLSHMNVSPRTLGIQLYCIAHNMSNWHEYNLHDFGDFADITLPKVFVNSIDELKEYKGK